jgi:hypothetical protein
MLNSINYFKTKTEAFIETGSYEGNGIQLAINSGFKQIYSIELCPILFVACQKRFYNNPSVQVLLGDSSIVLKDLLNVFPDTSFTFWLDGHYSGPGTAKGSKESPLMEELEMILSRSTTNDLIYIDDMRIYKNYDSEINEENIIKLVKQYRPEAVVTYEDTRWINDIMVIEY